MDETSQDPSFTPQPQAQPQPQPQHPATAGTGTPRKVAVIAVHGVGRHAAGETQNAIADLLLSLPANEYDATRTYSAFQSRNLRIPLQPLRSGQMRRKNSDAVQEKTKSHLLSAFDEQSAVFARRVDDTSEWPAGKIAAKYTDLLLEGYDGGVDSNLYETNRLEGMTADGKAAVHIYEVLWSDLSKPNGSIVTFFVQLFQLLLQLASLSRVALDSGAAEASGTLWNLQRRIHRYAIRMLQIFIPLFEILLFITLTSYLPTMLFAAKTASDAHPHISNVFPILFGGLGMHALFLLPILKGKWELSGSWPEWVTLALAPGSIGSLVVFLLLRHCHISPDAMTAVLWWLVPGAAFMGWILSKYKNIRAGVVPAGVGLFALALLGYVICLYRAQDPNPVPLAAFWLSQMLLAGIRLSWGALIAFALASSGLGWWACLRFKKNSGERARAKAAMRTSRLALALPSILFMLVTLLLWDGFVHLVEKSTKQSLLQVDQSSYRSVHALQAVFLLPKNVDLKKPPADDAEESPCNCVKPQDASTQEASKSEAIKQEASKPDASRPDASKQDADRPDASAILAWSYGYQLPVTLAVTGLGLFLMMWWALPSVITERFPYRKEQKAPRETDDATSLHMGTWLSRGLDATRLVTFLLWAGIFLVPTLYLVIRVTQAVHSFDSLAHLMNLLQTSTQVLVIQYAGLATVILAAVAKGGQTVLGILLDVDTYMSGLPERATPRAKIYERYASTLRFIHSQGYDSVVIAAHSLGALISGDILHYIAWEAKAGNLPDAALLQHSNTQLLTFGNPTRQLLNRFFPYLYDWVCSKPDNAVEQLPRPSSQASIDPIPDSILPLPSDLGVTFWASAYRSGDYVGRSLWLSEWFRRGTGVKPIVIRGESGTRAEVCIGAGAHTHYMDDTAPEMAVMLDQLIRTGSL